jgi:hypothetical protein
MGIGPDCSMRNVRMTERKSILGAGHAKLSWSRTSVGISVGLFLRKPTWIGFTEYKTEGRWAMSPKSKEGVQPCNQCIRRRETGIERDAAGSETGLGGRIQ